MCVCSRLGEPALCRILEESPLGVTDGSCTRYHQSHNLTAHCIAFRHTQGTSGGGAMSNGVRAFIACLYRICMRQGLTSRGRSGASFFRTNSPARESQQVKWRTRQDSNLQPSVPKTDALIQLSYGYTGASGRTRTLGLLIP